MRTRRPESGTGHPACHESATCGRTDGDSGRIDEKNGETATTASAEARKRTSGIVPVVSAVEHELALDADARAVVLVEGVSDRVAVQTLAELRGRDLDAEGVAVVPIGGAQAIGRYLNLYGPRGLGLRLAGLCDAGEEREFRRGLERAGLGATLAPRRDGSPRLLRLRRRTSRTS